MRFRNTSEVDWDRKGGGRFEAASLPDAEKERLCRSLLAEFGVTEVRRGGPGELIHACVLPFGNHRDQDRNPTASLNFLKLTYNCLGKCNSGGGLLWFIGLMRDTSGEQARKWLVDQTNLGDDEQSLSSLMDYFDEVYSKDRHEETPMPRMNPSILDPWLAIHPYLTEVRGIPEETIMRFRVGYGVIKIRVGPNEFIDSHRIVIPHFWRDTLVGWQTRRLIKDGTPKYHNSPDFPKDRTIYNYDPKAESVVVVESPMSVLSKAHIRPIEATFGANVTNKQMRYLSMHPKVILFCDNDEAGWKMTEQLGEYLERYSSVFVADNPYAADPADMDEDTYLGILNDAIPYALWSKPQELVPWKKEEALSGTA